MVREIEVEHELVADRAEIRALRRVEEVPPAAVRGLARGRVAEWQEHAARVGVEPEDLERTDVEIDGAESDERDHAAVAGPYVIALRRQWPDLATIHEAPVVVVVREPREGRAIGFKKGRLGVPAKELVTRRSPERVRGWRVPGSFARTAEYMSATRRRQSRSVR